MLKNNFFTILVVLYSFSAIAQNQFSRKQIIQDLMYLKKSLEDTHINLYAYVSKKDFNTNYQRVKSTIKKDSFSALEAKKIFQKVVSKANNGHTRISFPIPEYVAYAKSGGTLFPLEVSIENKKVLVRKNWSENSKVKVGDELIAINNIPIHKVLKAIYPQVSAERVYFKNAQIENISLPRFYWLVFGQQEHYKIDVKQNGKLLTDHLKPVKAIEGFEMKREDILKHGKKYKVISNSVAYIQPGDFGGDLKKYKQFIDSSFVEINTNSFKNLIIDLRNHSGGDDAFGDYIVSYIADKPFKWNSKFQLKTSKQLKEHTRKHRDTTLAYWKSVLNHKNGKIYDYNFDFYKPQPENKRFKGKVCVLVNRQSYSQSTVTASQIQDYGFGTIVGEETGEFPNLYASIYNYQLPNTNISVDVSKGKIARVSGVDKMCGVIPDIKIKDHLLDEKDEVLIGLLKILKDK